MNHAIKALFLTACFSSAQARGEDFAPVLKNDFRAIEVYLTMYKMSAGSYPTTAQGLNALVTKPEVKPIPRKWTQLVNSVPTDPWKREYQYSCKKGKISLWSKGPNEKDPSDDIYYEITDSK